MPPQKTGMLIEDLASLWASGPDHARGGEAVQHQGRFGEVFDHLGCLIGALVIRRGEGTVGGDLFSGYLPTYPCGVFVFLSSF